MEITVNSVWYSEYADKVVFVFDVSEKSVRYSHLGNNYNTSIGEFIENFVVYRPVVEQDTGDDIVVGSRWLYCGLVEVEVIDVALNEDGDVIVTSKDKSGALDYDMLHKFREQHKPVEQRDNKDDITVGSVWKSKESGNEFEVTGTEDGTGIPIDYFDIETGENYAASVYDFLKQYEFISVGSPMEFDNVNNPQHYTSGQVECIDAIRAALTDEEFRGFCKGNVLKYTWREKHKGGNESLEKAVWYLKQMVGDGGEK